MYSLVDQRLNSLINAHQQDLLKDAKIGLEREALRVAADGNLVQTPHPPELGSPLTHPWITTDFSEALIEFITPPMSDMGKVLEFLRESHIFAYDKLSQELLWATSMPCILAGEQSIPLANYGRSNAGMMKRVYRRGLGYRYGRVMQVIAGIHFNYSMNESFWPVFQSLDKNSDLLKDFTSSAYFGMIRNLQRYGWIVPYLFGASPTVCVSYLGDQPTDMEHFDDTTYYYPYATSLRMGGIGYQNNKEHEIGFKACYHSLDDYISSLTRAIETPCPKYEKIGVIVNGQYRQLNANLLQIENEYYSTVRPKQVPSNNEKPILALNKRGVQYVELRSLDINAHSPLGVTEPQLRFLEAFMVFCLLQRSPPISHQESREIDLNLGLTAHRGRGPSLRLQRHGQAITLRKWADEICDAMQGICELLDRGENKSLYSTVLESQREAIKDADRTPSAIMIAEMRRNQESFHEFAKRLSRQNLQYFKTQHLSRQQELFYSQESQKSIHKQTEIEQADELSFAAYLQRYFAQS